MMCMSRFLWFGLDDDKLTRFQVISELVIITS